MDETSPRYSKAQALRSGGKAQVREALLDARRRSLELADAYAASLGPVGLRVAYAPEVNLPLWELGHVGWFQESWIGRNRERGFGTRCDPQHKRLPSLLVDADAMFDSGRVEHRSRWELPLPSAQGTRDYLADTLAQTLDELDMAAVTARDDDLYFFRLVALHEAMHAEAATYMARSLGVQLPAAADSEDVEPAAALSVPAQTFRLGGDATGFTFDNELGAHEVRLDAFEIDSHPVSWGRFLGFVEAGGYAQRHWWSEAGWAWLSGQDGRRDRLQRERNLDAPAVHLSAHEADAWCRWAGRRLPSEAEWECAALHAPGFTWGQVWEWTASAFAPYPGFEAHPYRDYSAPWFGSRRVLRGACDATSPWLAHPRYRNFFEPQRTDIFAGFRSCARPRLPIRV